MSDTGENRIHEFVTKLVRVHSDITSMCVCVHSGNTSACAHSGNTSACTQWYY